MTEENEELKKRMSGVEEMVTNLIVDQQAMAKAFQERGDQHSRSLERHRADLNTARKDILRLKDNQSSIVDECLVLRTQVESMGDNLCRSGDVPSVLEVLTRCPWLPYSYPSLPTTLPLSRCLRDAFAMFSLEVLGPWSFPTVARAFRSSAELRSLPRSSLVFSEVLQSPPEFLLVRRSSSLSAGVPAASLEPLSLGVLRSSSARLPLSSEGFPLLSYGAAIAS